jgi:hypothetical protein
MPKSGSKTKDYTIGVDGVNYTFSSPRNPSDEEWQQIADYVRSTERHKAFTGEFMRGKQAEMFSSQFGLSPEAAKQAALLSQRGAMPLEEAANKARLVENANRDSANVANEWTNGSPLSKLRFGLGAITNLIDRYGFETVTALSGNRDLDWDTTGGANQQEKYASGIYREVAKGYEGNALDPILANSLLAMNEKAKENSLLGMGARLLQGLGTTSSVLSMGAAPALRGLGALAAPTEEALLAGGTAARARQVASSGLNAASRTADLANVGLQGAQFATSLPFLVSDRQRFIEENLLNAVQAGHSLLSRGSRGMPDVGMRSPLSEQLTAFGESSGLGDAWKYTRKFLGNIPFEKTPPSVTLEDLAAQIKALSTQVRREIEAEAMQRYSNAQDVPIPDLDVTDIGQMGRLTNLPSQSSEASLKRLRQIQRQEDLLREQAETLGIRDDVAQQMEMQLDTQTSFDFSEPTKTNNLTRIDAKIARLESDRQRLFEKLADEQTPLSPKAQRMADRYNAELANLQRERAGIAAYEGDRESQLLVTAKRMYPSTDPTIVIQPQGEGTGNKMFVHGGAAVVFDKAENVVTVGASEKETNVLRFEDSAGNLVYEIPDLSRPINEKAIANLNSKVIPQLNFNKPVSDFTVPESLKKKS